MQAVGLGDGVVEKLLVEIPRAPDLTVFLNAALVHQQIVAGLSHVHDFDRS